MDLDELARSLHVEVRTTSGQRRKKAIKRLRLIEAFRRSGTRPDWINYGAVGFGRVVSPEAWLSTWSGLSSRAEIPTTGARTAKEIEEAAIIDGCNKFDLYWKIFMPLSKPAIATVSIFTVLAVWNEFMLALIIINNRDLMPIQRGIMVFQGEHLTDYSLLMAGLTIATIPLLVIYFFLSKYIIKGITAGAVKG